MSRRKHFAIGFSTRLWVLCVVALLAGCGENQQEPQTGKTEQNSNADEDSDPGDRAPQNQELDLTQNAFMAHDLVEAFDQDSAGFLAAVGGRTIEISGPLYDVGHEFDQETDAGELIRLGEPFVMFSSGLKCLTKAEKPWSQYWRGDLAIVTGRMSEHELVLFDAEVTLVHETNIVTLAAEDLAAEFALDDQLATNAYDGWPIQVTGNVLEVVINEQGAANILLAGDDTVLINCACTAFEFHRVRNLSPGDRFTGTGEFLDYQPDQGIVEIGHCVPVLIEK